MFVIQLLLTASLRAARSSPESLCYELSSVLVSRLSRAGGNPELNEYLVMDPRLRGDDGSV